MEEAYGCDEAPFWRSEKSPTRHYGTCYCRIFSKIMDRSVICGYGCSLIYSFRSYLNEVLAATNHSLPDSSEVGRHCAITRKEIARNIFGPLAQQSYSKSK